MKRRTARRKAFSKGHQKGKHYWTVLVPYTEYGATEWHPDLPGEVLSRGAFKSKTEATRWAKQKLFDAPYKLKKFWSGEVRK